MLTKTSMSRGLRLWISRRPDRPWTVFVLLLTLGLVVVVLGPALLGRGVLLDVGLLRNWWPFEAFAPPRDAIAWRGDTVDTMAAVANVRAGMADGNLLTWTPYEVGGAPLAALPNLGLLNPLSWPYLVLPLWLAPAFVKLNEFLAVVGGMTLFLGRLGVRRSAGVLAGVVFFTSGFMVMWSNWPQTRTAAFIPLLFWALDRVVTNRRPIDAVLLSGVVASMLLGGFPAVTMFSLTAGGIYVLARGLQRFRDGGALSLAAGWGGAAVGVALGVGLAAVQLVPFGANLSTIGYDERPSGGEKDVGYLVTVVAPRAIGVQRDLLTIGPSNPIESTAYLGAAAFVLILVGVLGRRDGDLGRVTKLLGSLLLALLLLVWVGEPFLGALQTLPGYSNNSIGRVTSVFGFLGAALAGIGFHHLLERAGRSPEPSARPAHEEPHVRRRAGASDLVTVAGVAVGLFLMVRAVPAARAWAVDAGLAHQFDREAFLGGAVIALSLLGAGLAWRARGGWRLLGPAVVAVLVVGQSTSFAHSLLPTSDRADFYPVTDAHKYLQEHIGHDRYAGDRRWGYAGVTEMYRLRTPVGHEFTDPAWKEVLAAIDPDVQLSRTYSSFSRAVDSNTVGDEPLLDRLAVRYWVGSPVKVIGQVEQRGDRGPAVRIAPGDVGTCAVEPGPMRGVHMRLARQFRPSTTRRTVVHVRVVTAAGELSGERTLTKPLGRGSGLRVALLGEDLAKGAGPATVEVRVTGTRRTLALRGAPDGGIKCALVVPPRDDGLDLVFADRSAVVYERSTALPRIRWAAHTVTAASPEDQVALLEGGLDDDTAVLATGEGDASGSSQGSSGEASIDVVKDDPEHIVVDVDATGSGHLVVADSLLRKGWSATVDGEAVSMVRADRALTAVSVGEGRHRVELSYSPPGLRAGAIVSGGTAALAALLVLGDLLLRRRRRGAADVATPDPSA